MQALTLYLIAITCGSICIASISPTSAQSIKSISQEHFDFRLIQFDRLPSDIGNKEEVLQLFILALERSEKIEEQQQKINRYSYQENQKSIEVLSHIATQLAKAGFRKRAEIVFDRALELSKQKREDVYTQYQQDKRLRDVVIDILKAGFCDRALEEARKIVSPLARAETLYEIGQVFIERNNLESAREILLEAAKFAQTDPGDNGYTANGSCSSPKYYLLSQIAENLSHIFTLQSALNLAQKVRNCYAAAYSTAPFGAYQTKAFLGIIGNIEKVSELREIWEISQSLSNHFEIAKVWSEISKKLVKIGKYDFAIAIARKLADDSQFPTDDDLAIDEAMLFAGVQADYLQDIALTLAEKDELERSKQIVRLIIPEDRRKTAETLIERASEQTIPLDRPASDRADKNNNSRENRLSKITRVEQLEKELEMVKTQEVGQALTRGKIGLQFLKLGEIERGYRVINSLEGGRYEADVQVGIVKEAIALLVQQNDIEKALKLVQNIESVAIQAKLLADLGFHIAKGQ
ncbi:MAG: hypothetical protein AAGA60_25975 [Cyanobacteria bacterium P01_E01_bin.42]